MLARDLAEKKNIDDDANNKKKAGSSVGHYVHIYFFLRFLVGQKFEIQKVKRKNFFFLPAQPRFPSFWFFFFVNPRKYFFSRHETSIIITGKWEGDDAFSLPARFFFFLVSLSYPMCCKCAS